jgi:SEC-C motif
MTVDKCLVAKMIDRAPKIGRNDLCPCGGGKKFKKCHGSPSAVSHVLTQDRSSILPSHKLPFAPDHELDAEKLRSSSIRTERCIVVVEVASKRYKLLQVMFFKDGSLCLNFPYFKHAEGLTSVVTVPANITYPANPELNPGGKATTNLVKYSHHPDGRAHFSQDGRVRSTVRKQAAPLTEAVDHIFTIKLQGLSAFEIANVSGSGKQPASKRKVVNLVFHDIVPDAFKIVGRWYSINHLKGRLRIGSSNPVFLTMSEDGKNRSWGILFANPYLIGNEQYFLMLNFHPIEKFDDHREASMTFLGGFDHPDVINDVGKETTFLAFTYPVSNIDELATDIGTIDFRKDDRRVESE